MLPKPQSDPDPIAIFRDLQTVLLQFEDMSTFLQRLASVAARVMDPPVSCGVTSRYNNDSLTVASSDEIAARLDESQYVQDEGPCLTAMRTGKTTDIGDPEAADRWVDYAREMQAVGIGGVLAIPLTVENRTVGALNIYKPGPPGPFPDAVSRLYVAFAELAAGAVELAAIRLNDNATRGHLESALASRSVIDQALGILMALQRCTAEEAFVLLRKRSQASNTRLRSVAWDLVARTTGRPPAPPRMFDDNGGGRHQNE